MTLARTLFSIGTTLVIASNATAQDKRPDLAGRWTLDPQATVVSGGGRGDGSGNASGGGGRGGGGIGLGSPADELTIQQSDTMLIVEERRENDTAIIRYRLDGKRIRNLMPIGRGGIADASYSSRWNGSRLATSITRKISARGNVTEIQYRELLYLSSNGALVVETTVSGRPGGRKTVYQKVN